MPQTAILVRALISSCKEVLSKYIDLENDVWVLFKVFGVKLPPKLGQALMAKPGACQTICKALVAIAPMGGTLDRFRWQLSLGMGGKLHRNTQGG